MPHSLQCIFTFIIITFNFSHEYVFDQAHYIYINAVIYIPGKVKMNGPLQRIIQITLYSYNIKRKGLAYIINTVQ